MSRIPASHDFDQRIADWLEDDSDHSPPEVLGTILAAFPSIPQRRVVRLPWRLPPVNRFVLIAAAVGLLALAGVGLLTVGARPSTPPPTIAPPAVSPSPGASPAPTIQLDYSTLGGRILVEHLGNAPDGSELPTTDYHPERRRLYFMDPATMTGATAEEFLPGQPATGKLDADVSADGLQVTFMDTGNPARAWIANSDGTGLRQLSGDCTCSELDPAFDPSGTKIAFVHLEGAFRNSQNGANLGVQWDGTSRVTSWIGIRDIATGEVTILESTSADGADGLPYQPAWSPDGASIVFNRILWDTDGLPTGTLHVVDVPADSVRDIDVPDRVPGDADWAPDGTRILYTGYPWSAMGSIGDLPQPVIATVGVDGSDRQQLADGAGASYTPDGRIVYMANVFFVMNADGTAKKPVNRDGDDLSELAVGFAYIPHWVGEP
ncbi:MAG: hypothetical protein A2V85_00125 [Chloroflexi bacterium RBG_16_72_14]|nr:MAG: hypothetical protein A2V85_00125 [Chloroflexi bacterium RBG_16_72_14]